MLSIFTLILIATAISKMVMYISVYGLTQLRFYTTWFMLLLAVIFVMIIVKQSAMISALRVISPSHSR